jgi:hypothetical protein
MKHLFIVMLWRQTVGDEMEYVGEHPVLAFHQDAAIATAIENFRMGWGIGRGPGRLFGSIKTMFKGVIDEQGNS